MTERDFNDVCILQTRFGLKQYLWLRWIASDIAQVHDGKRVIAEMIQTSPHRDDEYVVHVYNQTMPINRWTRLSTTYRHTRLDLGLGRLRREAIKAWKALNPDL